MNAVAEPVTTEEMPSPIVFTEFGRTARINGTLQDVTQRRQIEEALRSQARTDALTGLLNRDGVLTELERRIGSGHAGTTGTISFDARINTDQSVRAMKTFTVTARQETHLEVQAFNPGTVEERDLVPEDFSRMGVMAGDVLEINEQRYEILFVGSKVNDTLDEIGHCTIAFNGETEASLPGTMCVEKKALPNLKVGSAIRIIKPE